MNPDLGLSSLLAALRLAGIRAGVAETARLQHVFSLPQVFSGDTATRLKSILRAVLAKDATERETIDRVVDTWVSWADRELDFLGSPQHPVLVLRSPSKSRSWRVRSFAALLVLTFAALLRPLPERRPPPPGPPPAILPEAQVSESPASVLLEAQDFSTRTFRSEVPVLEVIMPQPVWTGWTPLGLGALAAVSALGLWFALRKRRWLPEPAPLPERKGPPRVFLSPSRFLEPQLLEPRQQEALVWGIGRFVAEEPTRHVDLPASVRATVRAGGLPEVRYQKARHFREVWLWVDQAADDPALPRLADEVEQVLRRHGLSVERASFRGTPQLLVTPSGHVFAPGEVDELRDTALIAVLTDGRVLARQYTADDRRVVLNALLRGLSHWPHLVFVDFSAESNDLVAILARHNLEVISPAGLPEFLGNGKQSRGAVRSQWRTPGEDEAWAAAAALAPAPMGEAMAFDLRRHLGLRSSPWALRALRSEASSPQGLLWWSVPVRIKRLRWLCAAEQHVGGVAPGSLLARALDFWEGVYDREIIRREGEEGSSPWVGTPAQQHLSMERALLRLWRRPREATRELYALYRGALREGIRSHLAILAPAGRSRAEQVELPWRWEDRLAMEKAMLQAMGLGGELPAATLRRPGRLWLAIGACGGLALGALALSANSNWRFPPGQNRPAIEPSREVMDELRDVSMLTFIPIKQREQGRGVRESELSLISNVNKAAQFEIVDGPEGPLLLGGRFYGLLKVPPDQVPSKPSIDDWMSLDGVEPFYRVSVSNRQWLAQRFAPPGAKVQVRWRTEVKPCVIRKRTAEIWHCGTHPEIKQPSLPEIHRSIAILNPSPRSLRDAYHLATVLLDSGSADIVAFSSNWTQLDLNRLLGPASSSSESQVLFFSSAEDAADRPDIWGMERTNTTMLWVKVENWKELADSFIFSGVQAAGKVLKRGVQSLEYDTHLVLLRGVGAGT